MIKKYIERKPSLMRAVQWRGDNFKEVDEYCTIKFDNNEIHYAELWDDEKQRIALKGDMWCGDEACVGDYIIAGDEFYHVEPEDFEAEWEPTDEPNVYKSKKLTTIEAIQWNDNNTEECLDFIGSNGGLDASKTQILIMNLTGGAIANKGDFIIKWGGKEGDNFGSLNSKLFDKYYREL